MNEDCGAEVEELWTSGSQQHSHWMDELVATAVPPVSAHPEADPGSAVASGLSSSHTIKVLCASPRFGGQKCPFNHTLNERSLFGANVDCQ